VAVIIIFLSSLVLIPFANADRTVFRSNPAHSGAGTSEPTLTPTLLLNYNNMSGGYASPTVIGGVVYVGAEFGNIYALNATNDSKLWSHSIYN
jgi:outer membrane protein assembly factor BamB